MNTFMQVSRAVHMLDRLISDAQIAAENLARVTEEILSDQIIGQACGLRLSCQHRQALIVPIHATLQRNPWCNGAGFASYAPPTSVEEGYWTLEWWFQEGQNIRKAQLEQNQELRQRLDFRAFDWFGQPARRHKPFMEGPYVDYICNGAYTITAAHPVLIDKNFAGVAAVDLLVSKLDHLILPALVAIEQPALIVNGEGRVVTSTCPQLRPGSLWKDNANGQIVSDNSRALRMVVLPHTRSSQQPHIATGQFLSTGDCHLP